MTNAELIKALRYCASSDYDCRDGKCPYYERQPQCSMYDMMETAADALEDADKRIAELEKQMPKEGEWISVYDGFDYWVKCDFCGPETVAETSTTEAIAAWNRRANDEQIH